MAAQDHGVAVLEEAARLAVRQRDRLLAGAGQFEQAAALAGRGAGQRAGAEQVAGAQVAAVHGVVRHELRERPVGVAEARLAEAGGAGPRLAHARRLDPDLEVHAERAPCAVRRGVEVGQRLGLAVLPPERLAERRQRVERDDPGRDRRREALREERAERLVLPRLHVARAPVVEQRQAEHVVLGLVHAHRRAQRVRRGDHDAHLELVVQAARRRQHRHLRVGRHQLAPGAVERVAAREHGGCAPVVADRHPTVVRQQRVVGPEQPADRRRVVDARVEVGVVADLAGQAELDVRLPVQGGPPRRGLLAARAQAGADRGAQPATRLRIGAHDGREVRRGDQSGRLEIQQRVADRDAGAPGGAVAAEPAEGQVLQGEVAVRVVRGLDPAGEARVVRCVDRQLANSFSCRNAACRGARFVFDHSSSMSHFTASSLRITSASSGSGQASSSRCPLGSKK